MYLIVLSERDCRLVVAYSVLTTARRTFSRKTLVIVMKLIRSNICVMTQQILGIVYLAALTMYHCL